MKKDSIILRVVFIAAIIILLLIPNFMVQSLITERQYYRQEAINEVSESWAGTQIIAGPIITVIKKEERKNNDGFKYVVDNTRNYLPESIEIFADVQPETRYKGIYEIVLYKSKIKLKGRFDLSKLLEDYPTNDFDEVFVSFNVSDLRGIQRNAILTFNDKQYSLIPGLKSKVFRNGFYTKIQPGDENVQNFEIELDINGTENLNFIPIGKSTEVNVTSPWIDPSFDGAFLPVFRQITEEGFSAKWKINYFNRAYPQQFDDKAYDIFESAFGVKLLIPVDEYQKTMRTSKYSLMIIILTFLSFFLVEVFGNKIIHPVQYLLVGLSLIIFYSILLALSEYILFQYSYIIATLLIIMLIGLYVKSIYGSKQIAIIITGMLTVFYTFMYVILQLQDYSLLLGNIALFIILAAIMFFTRKINWFEVLGAKKNISEN